MKTEHKHDLVADAETSEASVCRL